MEKFTVICQNVCSFELCNKCEEVDLLNSCSSFWGGNLPDIQLVSKLNLWYPDDNKDIIQYVKCKLWGFSLCRFKSLDFEQATSCLLPGNPITPSAALGSFSYWIIFASWKRKFDCNWREWLLAGKRRWHICIGKGKWKAAKGRSDRSFCSSRQTAWRSQVIEHS